MSEQNAILKIAEMYTKHLRALPLLDSEKEHILFQWVSYQRQHQGDDDTLDVVRAYAHGFYVIFDGEKINGKTIEEVQRDVLETIAYCKDYDADAKAKAKRWLDAPKEARWYLLYCIEACLGGVINDLLPDILTEGNNIDVTAALVKDADDTTSKFIAAFLAD